MRTIPILLASRATLAFALLVVHVEPCAAQRRDERPKAVAADASVVGGYDFWFTPSNNEPISGRFVLSRRLGRYTAIVTSPKLSEPEAADSVSVTDGAVFLSFFAGQFTFTFRVSGDTISAGRFTKSVAGVAESGPLDLKRAMTASGARE